jgi:hypothetical protein
MPCHHKFQDHLDLTKIDFEPTTLIVGTFDPAWPASNNAEWFYGRTAKNYFWDVLPRLYGEPSLINAGAKEWKQFCSDQRIAITDLISSIDDAEQDNPEHGEMLKGFSDKAIEYNFDDLVYTNIVRILEGWPWIRNVYFTRGVTDAFWRHLWNPVAHYCSVNKIHERKLLTPTGDALYQYAAYNEQHPENRYARLEDYILMKWKQEWHF